MTPRGKLMDDQKTVGAKPGADGKVLFEAHTEKPASPSLSRRRVVLTLIAEEDDEVLAKQGLASLRQARVLRLCKEAQEQGGLLAYEDLTSILLSSPSTLKRDLRQFRKQGVVVPLFRKKY
jgi:uncharacterized protein DUF1670